MQPGKRRSAGRAKAPKRELLVRAAAELIYEKGCTASSLADIATAAGVPLGNVYHYFKTKEALAEAVINLRLAEQREVLVRAEQNERPENRIKHFLGFFTESKEQLARHGCPFGSLSVELEKYDSQLGKASRGLITTQLDWMRAQFELMGKGRRSGDLAFALLSRTQGSAVLAQVLRDLAVVQSAAEEIGAWIQREALSRPASRSVARSRQPQRKSKPKAPAGAESRGRRVSTI
jgi:TetR/AcrR family transcriptional repressor of nem operon